MATNIVDSFLVALGYEFEGEDLKKFQKSQEVVNGLLKTMAKAAAAATTAISAMTVASANHSNEVAKEARNARLAVDVYDAITFAAGQAQITSGAVASSLEQLSIRASEAARGTGSAVEAFGMLGLEITDVNGQIKATDQLLLEAADALNALGDQGQRLELADKLGIKDLNLLLKEGSVGINTLMMEARELGVVTAEDAKAAEAFMDEWARFKRLSADVMRAVATQILPVVTDLMETWREWVKENKKLLSSGLLGWLTNLGNILQLIKVVLMGIIALRIITMIMTLTKAIRTMGIVALAANAKVMAIPLAIFAMIAALGLAIEDVSKFLQGEDSLLGRILDSEAIQTIKKAISDFITEMVDKIKFLFVGIKLWFVNLFRSIQNLFIDMINGILKQIKKLPGGGDIELIQRVEKATRESQSGSQPASLPFSGLLGLGMAAKTLIDNKTINIEINGDNIEAMKQGLLDVLENMNSQAQSDLETQ